MHTSREGEKETQLLFHLAGGSIVLVSHVIKYTRAKAKAMTRISLTSEKAPRRSDFTLPK